MPLDVNPFDFWGEGPDATVNPASTEPLPAWTQADTPAPDAPAPDAPTYIPNGDPMGMYSRQVNDFYRTFGGAPNEPAFQRNLADTSPTGTDVRGAGPKPTDTGGGVFDSIRKFFGFSDTAEGRNASAAAVAGGISSLLGGATRGILDAPKREAEIAALRSRSKVDDAAAAVAQRKLDNQAGMSGLALNPAPGLLGFRAAPIVPIKTRTP